MCWNTVREFKDFYSFNIYNLLLDLTVVAVKSWRQPRLPSIHTVFTQDLELHLPDGRRTSVAFLPYKSGSLHLKSQLGAVFPPLPCYYAVSMAGGSNLNCTSCSCGISILGFISASLGVHPLPSLLPPF